MERDVAIGFFIVRKLYQHNKLSSLAEYTDVRVFSYPLVITDDASPKALLESRSPRSNTHGLLNAGAVSHLNKHSFLQKYDLSKETEDFCHYIELADRFIHGYSGALTRDRTRNWSDVYLISDRRRNYTAWRITVSDIIQLFTSVSCDYPAEIAFFLEPRKKNNTEERRRDYLFLSWSCESHGNLLRDMSSFIQNTTCDRETTVRNISMQYGCSEGLVRRLYSHLLHWDHRNVPQPAVAPWPDQ